MPKRLGLLLGSLFLSTGFALLVYILAGISLPAALCMVLAVTITVFAWGFRKARLAGRQQQVKTYLFCGFWSGLLATALYDISRFILIKITGIQFWPFDIFTVFGQSMLETKSSGPGVIISGVFYHFLNGTGFAIAYTLLFGHKGIPAGLFFAFGLELIMVSVYPGWLNLKALDEFLQVSVVGHIVYGVTLGYFARYFLTKKISYGNKWV